jgi:hypothetical protein
MEQFGCRIVDCDPFGRARGEALPFWLPLVATKCNDMFGSSYPYSKSDCGQRAGLRERQPTGDILGASCFLPSAFSGDYVLVEI